MRLTQTLFLTGTILPTLVIAGLVQARPLADPPGGASAPRIELAQAGEREERRGGGERAGGGGGGGAQRGGADRDGPPAAREKPEPRPAAKPEPREERAAPPSREKPEPRPAARPEREERPASPAARERQEAPAARERQEAPAAREREAPAAREKPAAREERPGTPAARERQETPGAREKDAPATRDKPATRPERDDTRDERPGRPDRTAPERPTSPERPTPPNVRQPDAPVAPNQRPGIPGKPVAPSGQQDRDDDKRDRREEQQQRRDEIRDQRQERREDRQDRLDDQREHRQEMQKQRLENQEQRLENQEQRLRNQRERQEDARERREDVQERREDAQERRDRFNAPGRPGYVPGGFRGDTVVIRDFGTVRRERQQYDFNGRLYYREPGRVIVRDRDTYFVRHDENERFRRLYERGGYRTERRGQEVYSYIDRPGGEQIVTITDDDGRLVRRVRRLPGGREVVLINNGYARGRPVYEDVVDLPPPRIAIPRERYQLDYGRADPRSVYETLSAPPVEPIQRRYSLDQVRYSPQLRARMPSVDINTITFDSGSFEVSPDQGQQLDAIAAAINQAVKANPQEVFLIEGYTDAVGDDVDNLSLSDRRAQSVAQILTESFKVPPENLTTQGYGEQYLKVNTQEASRENRRVTVRRITPLIDQQASGGDGDAPPPR